MTNEEKAKLTEEVKAILNHYSSKDVSDDNKLSDLGLDEIDAVEVLMDIEDANNIEVPDEILLDDVGLPKPITVTEFVSELAKFINS